MLYWLTCLRLELFNFVYHTTNELLRALRVIQWLIGYGFIVTASNNVASAMMCVCELMFVSWLSWYIQIKKGKECKLTKLDLAVFGAMTQRECWLIWVFLEFGSCMLKNVESDMLLLCYTWMMMCTWTERTKTCVTWKIFIGWSCMDVINKLKKSLDLNAIF